MLSKRGGLEKGFTLIELMVAIFIIGVLSAVAISYMRGRTDSAKWSEGKAIAGTIRTAAQAYRGEKGEGYDFSGTTLEDLGFIINLGAGGGDLDGKYFTDDCYSIEFSKNGDYLITINAAKSTSGDPPSTPRQITLDSTGTFTEIP
ncbi:MAG: type II secretion system protein [Sedimentisphaerales bacterium]